MLAVNAQSSAAGHQHLQRGGRFQKLHHQRRSSQNVLEIIQQQQHRRGLRLAQIILQQIQNGPAARLVDAQRFRNRHGDHGRIGDGSQRYKVNSLFKLLQKLARDLQAESRLAASPGAGQCDQPGSRREQETASPPGVPARARSAVFAGAEDNSGRAHAGQPAACHLRLRRPRAAPFGSAPPAPSVLVRRHGCREYVSPARHGFHDLLRPIVQARRNSTMHCTSESSVTNARTTARESILPCR